MIHNILWVTVLWLLHKCGDAVVDKALEKLLSDENISHLTHSLKLKILVLYLHWLLRTTNLDRPKGKRS